MGSQEGGAGPRRFRMRERFFDLGEDFTVEDEAGRPAFRVDGKVLALRKTFVLEDLDGRPLATIREPLVSLRDTVVIDRPGRPAATVKRALFSLLRPRFRVDLAEGDLEVVGDIIGHEFTIRGERGDVARISRSWFRVRDAYGVEVAPGEDAALMIAVAVALESFDRGE